MKNAIIAHSKYPNFYLGYDLVAEEDKFRKMKDIAHVFLKKE